MRVLHTAVFFYVYIVYIVYLYASVVLYMWHVYMGARSTFVVPPTTSYGPVLLVALGVAAVAVVVVVVAAVISSSINSV